jgi:hypothetical protein
MLMKLNLLLAIIIGQIFCCSCGKKFEEKSSNTGNDPRRDFASANSVVLYSQFAALKPAQVLTNNGEFFFDKDAEVVIPEYIDVTEGNAGNFFAKIEMNIQNGEAEFFCLYQGGASSPEPNTEEEIQRGMRYFFNACYQDIHGDGTQHDLGYYPGYEAIQDKDRAIRLVIQGADPRTVTRANTEIEILWH